MAVTNKRLLISESRGDSNRCTPCRGNPINKTRTLPTPVHVRPTYAFCGRSSYVATFRESSTGLDGCTAPEKNAPDSTSQPGTYRWQTARLTGPISPACDRYVQYLLMDTNPSVLNRHRSGAIT
jgi:hypothetical protein